jgi:hypothetical protein
MTKAEKGGKRRKKAEGLIETGGAGRGHLSAFFSGVSMGHFDPFL